LVVGMSLHKITKERKKTVESTPNTKLTKTISPIRRKDSIIATIFGKKTKSLTNVFTSEGEQGDRKSSFGALTSRTPRKISELKTDVKQIETIPEKGL
jgi:hypothetical protein